MDNQQFTQNISTVGNLLNDADSVGIIVTEHQTLDKVGAGLALYLALQEAGKSVQIVSTRDPLVEISNLVAIDKLAKSFEGVTKKLVVSLPYHEGEVEKVSYNIEGNKLNINLFAAKDKSISFSEKDVDFIRSGSNPSVLITIGIRKTEEMGAFVPADTTAKIIRLDTVMPQQEFGDVTIAGGEFSSISEIVAALVRELRLPVNQDIAQNLMDGVVAATNNFMAPQTSSVAFASAAYLLSHNARRKAPRVEAREPRMQEVRRHNPAPRMQPTAPIEELSQPAPVQEVTAPAPTPVEPQQQTVEQAVDAPVTPVAEAPVAPAVEEQAEEVPSDWFVPKVFKSSKAQE